MKMGKYCRFVFISFMLFTGCSTSPQHEHSGIQIEVPLSQADSPLLLSQIVDSLQYIKLETTEECLIGGIDQLFFIKDKFILLDSENTKSIFFFSSQGKFINKINRVGRGPEEYISIEDIAINEKDEQIIVWDSQQDKLLTYRFDGVFVGSMAFPYYGAEIEYIDDNTIALYCDYAVNKNYFERDVSANLIILNMASGEVKHELFFDNTKIRQENFTSIINNFASHPRHPALLPALTNSIYNVSSHGCEEEYYLDFGFPYEERMTRYINEMWSISADDTEMVQKQSNLPFVYNFLRSKDVLYLFYICGNQYYYGFYYPNSKTFLEGSRVFREGNNVRIPVDNDIDDTIPFMPIATDANNHFYYVLEPYIFSSFNEEKNEKLSTIMDVSSPNDNPIIVKAFMEIL